MKNRDIRSIFLMICTMVSIACYDDKGNYTYQDINEVTIGGVSTDKIYEKFAFVDTLKIIPQIKGSLYKEDLSNYRFEWKLIPFSKPSDTVDYVVGTEKDLVLPITQDPGNYFGFFRVIDVAGDTEWGAEFSVRVKTMTSEGWMILCESEGNVRFDWIAPVSENEDMVARDIWREKDYRMGKPYAIRYDYDPNRKTTLLCCEAGTYVLNKDMEAGEGNNLKWMFGSTPDRVDIAGSGSDQWTYDYPSEFLITKNGDLYVRNWLTYGSLFEFPINYLDGERIEIAPWVGIPWVNLDDPDWFLVYGHSNLFYDNTNLQFLELKEGANKLSVMKFARNTYFTPQTGKEMVFVQSNLTKHTYAILKDPGTENYYIYKMILTANAKNTQEDFMALLPGNSDKIKRFAFHPVHPFLYYATDHEVFQFDMRAPDTPAKSVLYFPDDVITVLKFNPMEGWNGYQPWEKARARWLVVGRNTIGEKEDECGKVEFYELPGLRKQLKLVKHVYKLGKIVDITYRER